MHWTAWAIGGVGIAITLAACVRGAGEGGRSQVAGKVNVTVFNDKGQLVQVFSDRVVKSEADWRAQLTPAQYDITRRAGTERPGTCGFLLSKEPGVYTCVACGLPLFYAASKFESGTGWPSFFKPIAETNVKNIQDRSFGMVRTETECARCSSHLGHVFDDGPPPTGQRYCMNGEALKFTPEGDFSKLADPAAQSPATQPIK